MIQQCVSIRPDGLLQAASNVVGACDYVITSGGVWDWTIADAQPVLLSVLILWAIAWGIRTLIRVLNSGEVDHD